MTSENAENTQDSKILTDPDKLGYGGWLRFYKIINVISMTLSILGLIVVGTQIIWRYLELDKALDIYAMALEILPAAIVSFAILKILKVQGSYTPDSIKNYIVFYIASSIIIHFVLLYLFKTDYISEKPTSLVGTLIFSYIWIAYFKKSKRVLSYYGQNAK